LVLFAMFYPVTTGTEVSRWYSDTFLRWLPSWPFY
jgi:dolichyl-phosphate-mannose--protein O-mannosyl transferase